MILAIELQVRTLRDSMKTECRRCYLSCARWELASSQVPEFPVGEPDQSLPIILWKLIMWAGLGCQMSEGGTMKKKNQINKSNCRCMKNRWNQAEKSSPRNTRPRLDSGHYHRLIPITSPSPSWSGVRTPAFALNGASKEPLQQGGRGGGSEEDRCFVSQGHFCPKLSVIF